MPTEEYTQPHHRQSALPRPCWRWELVIEQSAQWKEAVEPLSAVRVAAMPGKMQMSSDTRQVCD